MNAPFTPMRRHGTVVILAHQAGGFDLRDCPDPEALAELVVLSSNARDKLVQLLDTVQNYCPVDVQDSIRKAIVEATGSLSYSEYRNSVRKAGAQ